MKAPKILLLVGLSGFFAVNFAFAQTWTQTSAPTSGWESIAMSADGTKLVAASDSAPNGQGGYTDGGGIFTSTNSGTAWNPTTAPSNIWYSVASSADGNKLVAVGADPTFQNGLIYTSTNSGASWMPVNGLALNTFYFAVASSADGVRLAAVGGDGYSTNFIFTSTNSGATWKQTSAPGTNWTAIASSADGTKLVAVVNSYNYSTGMGGPIFISTNSGAAWTQASTISGPYGGWQDVASSADGTKLAAVDFNYIFVSADSGNTWTQTMVPQTTWASIASSADGTKLIAATTYQPPYVIYASIDSGSTWTSNSIPNQQQYVVASSADGNKLTAGVPKGGIYTSYVTPTPQMNITPTNENLMLSWIVPSTNFVLQQSSDLTSWVNLTNVPVLNLTNLQNQVTLPMSDGNGFYRLKTP